MRIKWSSDRIRVYRHRKLSEAYNNNKELALSRNNSYIISNIFHLFKFNPNVRYKRIEKYLSYSYGFGTSHYYCSDYYNDIDILNFNNRVPTIKSGTFRRRIYTIKEMADIDIYNA